MAYNIIAGRDTLYIRVTELTFKCHVMAPATEPPKGGFCFIWRNHGNIRIF